jgi:hypothetical protein
MLIGPAIGDTDPIRCRHPSCGGHFFGSILSEAMRLPSPPDGQTKKSSFFALPPFVAAAIQRGMRPRPVHVFMAFLGSRYLIATLPRLPLLPKRSLISKPCCLAMAMSFLHPVLPDASECERLARLHSDGVKR